MTISVTDYTQSAANQRCFQVAFDYVNNKGILGCHEFDGSLEVVT